MNGLMMDFPLTLNAIFRHAEQMSRRREIVWRATDKSVQRCTFADFMINVTNDGQVKPAGRVFKQLADSYRNKPVTFPTVTLPPPLAAPLSNPVNLP